MDQEEIREENYMIPTKETPKSFLCSSVDSGGTVIYKSEDKTTQVAVDLNSEIVFIKSPTEKIEKLIVTENSSEPDKSWIRLALNAYNQTFGVCRGSKALGIPGK